MFYAKLLALGKLNEYFVDIDGLAEKMFYELVKQMAEKQGVIEKLKAARQTEWGSLMSNISNATRELVYKDLIFS